MQIFYKKSGSVFGTQVSLTPATILGPELAVRQPISGEAQYFEYEIKKLKVGWGRGCRQWWTGKGGEGVPALRS